jgi:tripartite-type tricarboxylate transporter receptor subunit TctC
MKIHRRTFLRLAAGTAALSAAPGAGRADTYPSRPVRIIVGFPAGSASDILARVMAPWLSERLGQQFVIENRTGAATNIAAELVAHASPDGYMLLFITSTSSVNATLYPHLNFNFPSDFAPIGSFDLVPYVLELNPGMPAKTVPEFIAYAKAHPGQINMATQGIGSGPHVAGELFNMMAGVKLVHVPYSGNPYPDLIGGQVQGMFSPIAASIGYVKSGQLRPLAVSTPKRLAALPDLPTISEFVPGYEANGWHGLAAPKGTSDEIIERIAKVIDAGVADPQMQGRFVSLGLEPMPMAPAAFAKFVADDTAKWAKVIKFADIKAE